MRGVEFVGGVGRDECSEGDGWLVAPQVNVRLAPEDGFQGLLALHEGGGEQVIADVEGAVVGVVDAQGVGAGLDPGGC